jgi:hypothetical protein
LSTTSSPTADILPFQLPLCPALPQVIGNKDYTDFEIQLERIDGLLRGSGVEALFVRLSLDALRAEDREAGVELTDAHIARHREQSRLALRCEVLRELLMRPAYRVMSRRLAESALCRRFCGIGEIDRVRVPGKSRLQTYSTWLAPEAMRAVLDELLRSAGSEPGAARMGLEARIELNLVLLDSTCLKANIHFPTDWVLLRDAVRTLMKATVLIRGRGICARMESPGSFLARMNKCCMAMAAAGRKPGSKKKKKALLRQMKALAKTIAAHARRHRAALDERWAQTGWSRGQTQQILRRIDGILGQLPAAINQAHERIIGERPVASAEKILSLYEKDLHVIVRGKAGAEVEFGNTLLLGENLDGIIVDHALLRDTSPGDTRLLGESLARIDALRIGPVQGISTDRGFASRANSRLLGEKDIFDATCPRDPAKLTRRHRDDALFAACQRRRAQTEARVGILKNNFLSGQPRARGYGRRAAAVDWAVLAHNLRVIARLPQAKALKAPANDPPPALLAA